MFIDTFFRFGIFESFDLIKYVPGPPRPVWGHQSPNWTEIYRLVASDWSGRSRNPPNSGIFGLFFAHFWLKKILREIMGGGSLKFWFWPGPHGSFPTKIASKISRELQVWNSQNRILYYYPGCDFADFEEPQKHLSRPLWRLKLCAFGRARWGLQNVMPTDLWDGREPTQFGPSKMAFFTFTLFEIENWST
jgi:hypothetical protein